MKIKFENNEFKMELTKYEYALVAISDNLMMDYDDTMYHPYFYDIEEIFNDEREIFVFDRSNLDISEDGFIMWSETFFEIIQEFVFEDPEEGFSIEINPIFDIEVDRSRFNGIEFCFRRFHSDDFYPGIKTPWEIWFSNNRDDSLRISRVFYDINDAKNFAKEISRDKCYDEFRNNFEDVYKFK